jgi:hypothetical protein
MTQMKSELHSKEPTRLLAQLIGRSVVGAIIFLAALPTHAFGHAETSSLTSTQIGQVVDHLQIAARDYVFPETAAKLEQEIKEHRAHYLAISDPRKLAEELTADMRAVGHDQHLVVNFGEELGVQKEPTPAEVEHAHAFDRANGFGLRSARRLPGNIGYIDIAYFSPDSDAGAAIASSMRLVSGTDALIIDLRQNGGGSGPTMDTLASYFVEDVTQLSGVIEKVNGKTTERQHWSTAYLEGPRYLGKPVYLLTSRHTHSAAEVLTYDLKNLRVAIVVGDRTSGEATSGTGEISLGFGFSTFIPNGQIMSPVTHGNYFQVGVQPDVAIDPENALVAAYGSALKAAKPNLDSDELKKEKAEALKDPKAALLQEINGFRE